MSSARTNYERLESEIKAGGKWEKTFRAKVFRPFTPAQIQQKKDDMRRILAANAPPLIKFNEPFYCPNIIKDTIRCGYELIKKDEIVPQGTLVYKCPRCEKSHRLTVRPPKDKKIKSSQ